MARKKSPPVEDKKFIQVKLKWASSENLETIYVNHMSVSRSGTEFYVVFGELPFPAVSDPSEIPSELEIIPKVRLAIAPDAIKAIADVLYKHVHDNLD